MFAHKIEKLSWNFVEDLLGKQVRIVLKIIERHELDDVSSHVLAVGLRVKSFIVSIEYLHSFKIRITHSDYNNSTR